MSTPPPPSTAAPRTATPTARVVSTIGIWTRDLPASLAFYRLLGLAAPDPSGAPFASLTLANGLTVLWTTDDVVRAYDPDRPAPERGSRVQIEIQHDTPADVDATYQTALEAGHTGHLPPFDAFWGARFAVLLDPDANPVALTSPTTAPAQ